MGTPVLIIGESGSGKSTSLRNFQADEVCVLNVANKPLPFRTKLPVVKNATYQTIGQALSSGKFNNYVIDDSQFLLAFELFDRADEKGYDKFISIAVNFYKMIKYINQKLPENVYVYFMHHTEEKEGKIKAKTIGKMLDEKLSFDSLFTVVLHAECIESEYKFRTNGDGKSIAKTPMGMFSDNLIDNDLKLVNEVIRKYWEEQK